MPPKLAVLAGHCLHRAKGEAWNTVKGVNERRGLIRSFYKDGYWAFSAKFTTCIVEVDDRGCSWCVPPELGYIGLSAC